MAWWHNTVRQQAITWVNVHPDLCHYGVTKPEWAKCCSNWNRYICIVCSKSGYNILRETLWLCICMARVNQSEYRVNWTPWMRMFTTLPPPIYTWTFVLCFHPKDMKMKRYNIYAVFHYLTMPCVYINISTEVKITIVSLQNLCIVTLLFQIIIPPSQPFSWHHVSYYIKIKRLI